jgi:hypothetical protein
MRRRTHIGYWGEIQKDQDIGGWTTLKWILECDGMDWVDVAQDREQWRALVNILSTRLLPKNTKIRIYKKHNFACGSVWV